MYAPRQFREDRQDVLLAAMRSIRFAALVVPGEIGLEAVHLPLLVRADEAGVVLEGHVSIGNPVWKTAEQGIGALALFQGPQAYVHPGWYATKRDTGKVVPTWNYVAVHARGRMSAVRDPAWLLAHVTALTESNEAGRTEPWSVSDAPEVYIDGLVQAIVGVRMEVHGLEGVWKMIQHHPQANRLGVIAGLTAEEGANAQEMARVMAARERQNDGA